MTDMPLELEPRRFVGRLPRRRSATVLVWDASSSLIPWGLPSDEQAHRQAFTTVVGRPPIGRPALTSRTDAGVANELLRINRLSAARSELLPRIIPELRAPSHDFCDENTNSYAVPDSSIELLEMVHGHSPVKQTLVARDVRVRAVAKLEQLGLAGYFDPAVASFGSDHVLWSKLLDVAMYRLAFRECIEIRRARTYLVTANRRSAYTARLLGMNVIEVAPIVPTLRRLASAVSSAAHHGGL